MSWKKMLACLVMGVCIGLGLDRTVAWRTGRAFTNDVSTSTVKVIGVGQMPPANVSRDVQFKLFWELWNMLKDKYYQQPVADQSLFYGSMSGLAASLGDPYTTYFDPKSAQGFQQALSGHFDGIGAQLGFKNDQLVIIAPLPDTPAARAGIMPGDLIVKINGTDATSLTLDAAVDLIRGDKGTKVTLTLYRPSAPAAKRGPFEVAMLRDQIDVKSVTWKMLHPGIAYVQITSFNAYTIELFNQAVDDILKRSPSGIILDLRNDPGGFLDGSLHVAGEWIGTDTVVKERRQGTITQALEGIGGARLHDLPTIVLVNQGSASAAEIVAGALQDHGQATLVGKKTFGKGSVQDYQNLSDGSALKITIAEWLTPNDRTINKTGLDPDVVVDRTPEDYAAQRDPQLDRAVGILQGTATGTRASAPARPQSAPVAP